MTRPASVGEALRAATERLRAGGSRSPRLDAELLLATALGVEDKEWGHRLRAFVVKTEGASVDEEAIKTYVKENLARYKVPREVIFLDELPRNPTGKILKRELREL